MTGQAKKQARATKPNIDPTTWRNGSAGFFQFLADVKPRVRDGRGGFVPYNPTGEIRTAIAAALDGTYSTAIFCWPRRHGKTVAAIMIALWRFITRSGESMAIVANSQTQATDTAFKALLDAFRQTPFLKELVSHGEIKVGADRIEAAELSNIIQAFPANPGALWGKKLTLAQISELHAAQSAGVLDALQGSLLDSAGSLLLIDSTVGPRSSPLYALHNAANDPESGIYFSHIQYADLADAIAKQPAWIDAKKLRNLSRTMLPQQFGLLHLNRWGDASSSLFPAEVITRCIDDYSFDLPSITAGAAHVVGGGLDRAFGMSLHGDATFTTCVVKTVVDEDEHFFVLASDPVAFSTLGGIRANFTHYARAFGMSRCALESYNAGDVRDWAFQQSFSEGVEVIHPSRNLKAAAFTTLYSAAAEGRLHIHPSFKRLLAEMETFEVSFDGKRANDGAADADNTVPRFRHANGCHDDALHSLCWAVHSLRESTLNAYELDGVHCYGSAPNVSLCALNGGQMIPFGCADTCRSMHAARRLHVGYLARHPVIPLPLDEFIVAKVKNVGPHSLPR